VFVFLGSAMIATMIMGPAWLVERRIRGGSLTQADVSRMRQNIPLWINMLGEAMYEASEAGEISVLESQLDFLLETLDGLDPEERSTYGVGVGFQLGGIMQHIDDTETTLGLMRRIGVRSDIRVRSTCSIARSLATPERLPDLLAFLPPILSERRAADESLIPLIELRCDAVLADGIRALTETVDDDESAAVLSEALVSLGDYTSPIDRALNHRNTTAEMLHTMATALADNEAARPLVEAAIRAHLDRADTWELDAETGTSDGQMLLVQIFTSRPAIASYTWLSQFALEAPEVAREQISPNLTQIGETARQLAADVLLQELFDCIAANQPLAQPVDTVIVRLQAGSGTRVTAVPPIDACLEQATASLSLPGQDGLVGEFVVELTGPATPREAPPE